MIALPELLYSAQTIYSRTFQTIPLLVVASIWYLIVTSILSIGQSFLEKRYSRGTTRVVQRTWSERLTLRRRPNNVDNLEADRARPVVYADAVHRASVRWRFSRASPSLSVRVRSSAFLDRQAPARALCCAASTT